MLKREQIHYLKETALHLGYFVEGPITENGVVISNFDDDSIKYELCIIDDNNNTLIRELKQETDNKQYDLRKYKDNEFHVYEELDYFIVVVNGETYILNSYVDVNEFIMNYNI